jgi:hypothetical protein
MSRPENTSDRLAQVSVTSLKPVSRPERKGVKVVESKPGMPGVFFGTVKDTADVLFEANFFHRV